MASETDWLNGIVLGIIQKVQLIKKTLTFDSRSCVYKLSTIAITSTSSALVLRYPWRFLRSILVPPASSNRNKQATLSFFAYPISMSSTTLFRFAARTQPTCFFRSSHPARRLSPPRALYAGSSATATCNNFSTSARRAADKDGQEAAGGHHEESFEEFTARYAPGGLSPYPLRYWPRVSIVSQLTYGEIPRYEKEFDNVQDVFELQVRWV